MIVLNEPKVSFVKTKIRITKINEELDSHGVIPGMVFECYEELHDEEPVGRYWVKAGLCVEAMCCEKLE